jgi:single-stranded-DNA-specific exonuclease
MKINLVNENFDSDYVANLLRARGIENVEDYFHPTRKYLQDPTDLKNIRLAAALYTRIVLNDKPPYSKVLIVVDSDNDGYTSAAIIYQYTKRLNCHCKVDYWLHEGKQHGLQDHIGKLLEQDCQYDLIILPDSSSNDAHYHDMLDEINTPCLILDHHLTDVKLSDNAVVVNNQLSPNYKNKDLTGAGVVYQFCRYVDSILGQNWADDYMDLAAWGIIGDMGSMLEMENRYLAYEGLNEAHIKNSFLKCLLEKRAYSITGNQTASWKEIVEKTDAIAIAFYVVPLVNAMIRVGTMAEKERLFLAFVEGDTMVPCGKRGAKGTMERVDVESTRECTNAKSKQDKMKEVATDRLEAKIYKYDLLENKVLFVRLDDDDDFPAEMNGLIATQLAARFKKPTIVARLNNQGFDRGSARVLNQSELKDFRQFLLNTEMFEYAQGHANAFGISIPDYKLREFHAYANEALRTIDFGENAYDVNFVRASNAADLSNLVMELGEASAIWGQNNPQPLIHVAAATVSPSSIRVMGANQDTVRIDIDGIPYIKFHAKDFIQELKAQTKPFAMEIVCKPNLNEWMGRITPQMIIEDCEIKETTLF